jgi:hypothetical protein
VSKVTINTFDEPNTSTGVHPFRRFFALLAAPGLFASAIVYAGSFIGVTLDRMRVCAFILHIGIFVFLVPMVLIERSVKNERKFLRARFRVRGPAWTRSVSGFLGAFLLLHFVLFLIFSHGAAPEIVDGRFVLSNHGAIVRELTEAQYQSLKGDELRLFATGWLFFYFQAVIYWWFPAGSKD